MVNCPALSPERREQIRAALADRGLRRPPEEVARMAGVDPKTVRRFLRGKTFSLATAAKLAAALRVDLDSLMTDAPPDVVPGAPTSPGVARVAPVTSWKEAANVLGVHRSAVWERRKRVGDTHAAWWPTPAACLAWFEALAVRGW